MGFPTLKIMFPHMKQGRVLTGLLTVALAGGALVATAPAASAVPTPKSGTNVLVFNDPDFVDTIPLADVDPDNADHEGANMILALQSQGHTVSEVTGMSAATLTAALKGKHTFVIPELEESPWVTELSTDARSAIVTWIRGGGTLVVAADDRSTLNDLFGYRLETRWEDEDFEWIKTTPKGSAFAGSETVLPANDGSVGVMTASLPAGAVAQYTSTDDGSDRTAGVVTFGQGRGRGLERHPRHRRDDPPRGCGGRRPEQQVLRVVEGRGDPAHRARHLQRQGARPGPHQGRRREEGRRGLGQQDRLAQGHGADHADADRQDAQGSAAPAQAQEGRLGEGAGQDDLHAHERQGPHGHHDVRPEDDQAQEEALIRP